MTAEGYLNRLFGLHGKIAVVTGGTGTLGATMAAGLAAAGAEVVVVGRSSERGEAVVQRIQSLGGSAWFSPCDVTSKAALGDLLVAIEGRSGGVDILVNGAGVNSPTPVLEIEEKEFEHVIQSNLISLFHSCQLFGASMLENGGGAIINIGSVSGVRPLSRVFTYSLSKAAVHNLSRNLAREWAARGVRVNTLIPGFFPARQNRRVLDASRVADIMAHTPMGRFGEADELIGATLLLASEKAGSFVTGIELIVDGGFTATSI